MSLAEERTDEAPSAAEYVIRSNKWDTVGHFAGVESQAILMTPDEKEEMRHTMWTLTQAEYDSRYLSAFLRASNLVLSPEFWSFEGAWARDEESHYYGVRWLYALIYGTPLEEIEQGMASKAPDFTHVTPLLNDEFNVCVALCYDELSSARAYAEGIEWAQTLGPPQIAQFFKNLARDEMLHHLNVRDLLSLRHRDRIAEIPETLRRIIAFDTAAGHKYRQTFLFDHTPDPNNPYGEEFLVDCANYVCSYFGLKY